MLGEDGIDARIGVLVDFLRLERSILHSTIGIELAVVVFKLVELSGFKFTIEYIDNGTIKLRLNYCTIFFFLNKWFLIEVFL